VGVSPIDTNFRMPADALLAARALNVA